jgi:hypothetical protein
MRSPLNYPTKRPRAQLAFGREREAATGHFDRQP